MIFENSLNFFVSMIMVEKAQLPVVFMKFPTLLLLLRFVIIIRSIKLYIYIFTSMNWLYIDLYVILLVSRIHFDRTQSKETH